MVCMKEFVTTREEIRTEYIVEKSKFIITVAPVQTEGEAQEFIKRVSKEFWDASHNCTAFVIGPNQEQQRSSDNGEPSGTAGKPILEVLKKREITNTAIVVTRYFGGIKLGAGGLIRAYSTSASLGLNASPLILHTPKKIIHVTIAYNDYGTIERWMKEKDFYGTTEFGSDVELSLYINPDQEEMVLEDLQNLTGGNVLYEVGEIIMTEVPYSVDGEVDLEGES